MTTAAPLSIYVHIPWCERKCPYCDFNSHVSDNIPETEYVRQLQQELEFHQKALYNRPVVSIFFGGGTPSLFSGKAIQNIISHIKSYAILAPNCEITLEANPGSAEQLKFIAYKNAGINRLSIGIQSFNNKHLTRLGRIHNKQEAIKAISAARDAGINNLNIDIMYGLSEQTTEQAINDLQQAIDLNPNHISWYQLTIEQNTAYYNQPPPLPSDIITEQIEKQCRNLLKQAGYNRYEVSAYAKTNKQSQHNLNYWQFGDYLGIGAGAHSKLTDKKGLIKRLANTRLPKDYLSRGHDKVAKHHILDKSEVSAEFMMNALRLTEGVNIGLYEQQTGLNIETITPTINKMVKLGTMKNPKNTQQLCCTPSGYELLNSVVEQFL